MICSFTHLPFGFGKVLLDLLTDRMNDVVIVRRVSTDPEQTDHLFINQLVDS